MPILIALGDIESGVTSWAFRLQRAMHTHRHYEVILMNCWPMGRGVGTFDVTLTTERAMREYLRAQAPCVVIPNFFWEIFPICADLAARGVHVWTLGYCRADSEDEYYAPLRWLEPVVGRFVPVSRECAAHLAEAVPRRASDLATLPTAIDVPEGLDRTWQTAPLRLAYGGRMAQLQKRVMDFVPLVEALERRGVDYHLTLAGGGAALPVLKKALEPFTATERITFTGTLPAAEMETIWRDADVFLQLSDFEGTSNSLIESMAQGCVPVVTRASSGIADVVTDGRSGHVVEVGDMEAMADRIAALAQSRDRLAELGLAAFDVARGYDIGEYAARLAALLDDLTHAEPRTWPIGDGRGLWWACFRNAGTPLGRRPRFLKPPWPVRALLYLLGKLRVIR